MIDNAALLIFGLLIVYTVYRAHKLDKLMPWFSVDSEPPAELESTLKRRNQPRRLQPGLRK
jgi:hypothetical protein